MKILKDPFVQFLVVGTLIFLAYSFSESADRSNADLRIVIDGPTQKWIYGNFKKQFRRPPSRLEMSALIRAFTENEIKYRESLSLGLDDRDSIVRRRMMQKFDFLFGNGAADIVPADAVLREWYEARSDEFTLPDTISFTHIWFSPDKRGSSAVQDAAAALAKLQSGEEATGDSFPLDASFESAPRATIRSVMGVEFTEAILKAPVGVWSGPIASGFGQHVVRVTDKTSSQPLPFEQVRESVLQRWREVESERILMEMLAALEENYEIELDEGSLLDFEYAPDNMGHAP